MLVRGKGATLHGPEGRSPPLPFIEVDDAEGERLIARGLAVAVEAPEPAPEEPAKQSKTPKAAETAPKVPEPPQAPENAAAAVERAETILHALDLVEESQRDDSGPRQGMPTIAAIAEITGLADVTAEEIDAAVAKHAAA